MGPRLVSRGKVLLMDGVVFRNGKLQWGRDLLVAESILRHTKQSRWDGFNGAATC